MPKPEIRTKWHRLLPLIEADEVYLTAPKDGTAPHWSVFKPDCSGLCNLIDQFSELPKFVIDPELVALIREEDYQHSLLDMKKAEVLRLPYPAMIVEMPQLQQEGGQQFGSQSIVLLRDTTAGGRLSWEPHDPSPSDAPFYAIVLRVMRDDSGEYVVISPSVIHLQVDERNGTPWLGVTGKSLGILTESPLLEANIRATYIKDAGVVWQGLASALLLMATSGVKKEVVETKRLNRKRAERDQEPIPQHTYIYISHVYKQPDSREAEAYDPRRSPRPHWRRGHNRNVRTGKGRTGTKLVFFPGKLVAYHGAGPKPSQARDYIVTP